MKGPNLSEWALEHQSFVLYLIIALALAGAYAYVRLGQAEDPDFTFKVMVVRTLWPGATAREVEQQVTERLEKKLQETPWFDYTRSYSKPGESLIFVLLKDYTPPKEVPNAWYQVHKKIADIRHTLPAGVQGPFLNDEFGDTFGTIYAFTSDGYSFAELRDYVDRVRNELLRVPDVAKIDMIGDQEEKIYIETSHRKLATLGIDPLTIFNVLRQQNNLVPAGNFETKDDRIFVRVSGAFESLESVREIGIQANGRLFRLGDIAEVYRGYVDPPLLKLRHDGREAIGLAIAMRKGGDILALGHDLKREMARLERNLPVGIEVHLVTDQPTVVGRSVKEFMRTLAEAVVIVLAVSFISLGLRTGVVVALSIPLVLAVTFLGMLVFGIDLQRISLGALIIALGSAGRRRHHRGGDDGDQDGAGLGPLQGGELCLHLHRAVHAHRHAGHCGRVPAGGAGEVGGRRVHLLDLRSGHDGVADLVGRRRRVHPLPRLQAAARSRREVASAQPDRPAAEPDRAAPGTAPGGCAGANPGHANPGHANPGHANAGTPIRTRRDVYDTPFYRRFRRLVTWCVTYRWVVIGITLAVFVLSIAGFGLVQQQFFPSANRPELVVDLWLPSGASIVATDAEAKRFEKVLEADPDVESYVVYVGGGSPRFYLPLDQQLFNANLAEFVVTTRSNQVRDTVAERLLHKLDNEFTLLRGRVQPAAERPAGGLSGAVPDQRPGFRASCGAQAEKIAEVMRANPHMYHVHLDWNELAKVVRLEIDQNKARLIGVASQDLSNVLNSILTGFSITQYRERDKLIEVLARAEGAERRSLEDLSSINVPTQSGRWIPLSQIATVKYDFEEGLIWRRNRVPTITVQGDIVGAVQAPVVSKQIDPQLDAIRAKLPPGYRIEMGGAIEESARGQASVNAVMPIMLLTVVTLLMMHLQSMQKTILVLLTAPLGLIGVTLFLLVFRVPFGFVAMLGVIALSGMIMRNSIILVDQIDQDLQAGPLAVGGDHRIHRAPLPADHADRGGRDPGDDPAHAQQLLGADGGGHHGRPDGGHGADAAVSAGAVRGLVQGAETAARRVAA